MEKALDKQMDEVMNGPGVEGVLCADERGLCLGAKGNAKNKCAGLVSNISQMAAKLNPESKEAPVISIETDHGVVLIKTHENVTTAVYKTIT